MGIWQRLSTITKSKVNGVLDAMEGDGEACMEQTLTEAKVEFAQEKVKVAEVNAIYKRYKDEQDKLLKEADEFHGYAVAALKSGSEENAAKNLSIEKKKRAEAAAMQDKIDNAKNKSDQAKSNLEKMRLQIKEAEDTMKEVKMNNRVAKSSETAAKGVVSESALARFDKYAAKSQARYEVANAMLSLDEAEVDDEADMRAKYGDAVAINNVLDELNELKKSLNMI